MTQETIREKTNKRYLTSFDLYYAAYNGNMNYIKNTFCKHVADIFSEMCVAALHNKSNNVWKNVSNMISRNPTDPVWDAKHQHWKEEALQGACQGNQMEIVKYLLQRGAKDVSTGLITACEIGNMEMLKLMIHYGATNFDSGLNAVCANNHKQSLEMLELMIQLGARNVHEGMERACLLGNMQMIHLLISHGATWDMRAFRAAGLGGHLDMMKMIKEKLAGINMDSYAFYMTPVDDYNADIIEYFTTIFSPYKEQHKNEHTMCDLTMVNMLNMGKPLHVVEFFRDTQHIVLQRKLIIQEVEKVTQCVLCSDVITVMKPLIAYSLPK